MVMNTVSGDSSIHYNSFSDSHIYNVYFISLSIGCFSCRSTSLNVRRSSCPALSIMVFRLTASSMVIPIKLTSRSLVISTYIMDHSNLRSNSGILSIS